MGILQDIGFSGIRSQVQSPLQGLPQPGGSQFPTSPFSGFKQLPPSTGIANTGGTRDGSFPTFPQQSPTNLVFQEPPQQPRTPHNLPQPNRVGGQPNTGLTMQDRIAQIQQNAQRNPFITGGFPNFPTQGQLPSFNNRFFTNSFPQGLDGSKNL